MAYFNYCPTRSIVQPNQSKTCVHLTLSRLGKFLLLVHIEDSKVQYIRG